MNESVVSLPDVLILNLSSCQTFQHILSEDGWMDGWIDEWIDGWKDRALVVTQSHHSKWKARVNIFIQNDCLL